MFHDGDLSRFCKQGRFTDDFNFKDMPEIKATEIQIPFMLDSNGENLVHKVKKGDLMRLNSLKELLMTLE